MLGFNGGSDPKDGKMYYNKRAEVWGEMREWLEAGASIPDDPELAADLAGITFDYSRLKVRHGSIILESKDEMKRRGLRSPDKGDTLAMSFAVTLATRPEPKREEQPFGWSVPRASDGFWMQ